MKKFLLPLVLFGGLLAACGGRYHDENGMEMTPPPAGDGATTVDKYTSQVAALVTSVPEDTEPATVDESAATMPEDTEPQAVQ